MKEGQASASRRSNRDSMPCIEMAEYLLGMRLSRVRPLLETRGSRVCGASFCFTPAPAKRIAKWSQTSAAHYGNFFREVCLGRQDSRRTTRHSGRVVHRSGSAAEDERFACSVRVLLPLTADVKSTDVMITSSVGGDVDFQTRS
jgi:hypothetical protein